jgi:hypothetical protein
MTLDLSKARAGKTKATPSTPRAVGSPPGTLAASATVQTIQTQAQARADQMVIESREAVRSVMQATKGRIETAIAEELEGFGDDMAFTIGSLLDSFSGGAPVALCPDQTDTIDTTATEVPA